MEPRENLKQIKARRGGLLEVIQAQIPFGGFLNIRVERLGNELSFIMPYDGKLVGNPTIPALHGGGVAGFMEYAAIVGLTWNRLWEKVEADELSVEEIQEGNGIALPKTIDINVDYLRPGLSRDCYDRVRVNRSGRRYSSVHVESWQDERERLFAQLTGHFLMPAKSLVKK